MKKGQGSNRSPQKGAAGDLGELLPCGAATGRAATAGDPVEKRRGEFISPRSWSLSIIVRRRNDDVSDWNEIYHQCLAPPGPPGRSALSPPGTRPTARARAPTVPRGINNGP